MKPFSRSRLAVSVVPADDSAAFLRLYRHHPGGTPITRQDLAAPGCIALLARDDRKRPVGALALRLLPGRRASCYFPVIRVAKRLRRECGVLLGEMAVVVARRAGARYLECQYEQDSGTEDLEPLPQAIMLPFVAKLLLLRRHLGPATDRDFETEPGTAGELLAVMSACYKESADPSIRSMIPHDDLANMLHGPGISVIRKLPGHPTKGAALLRHSGGAGQIVFLGVPSRYQRRGNGRRLLLGCLNWFATKDCRLVDLAVALNNLPAHTLYRSEGFRKRSEAFLFRRPIDDGEKDPQDVDNPATIALSSQLRVLPWH